MELSRGPDTRSSVLDFNRIHRNTATRIGSSVHLQCNYNNVNQSRNLIDVRTSNTSDVRMAYYLKETEQKLVSC